jgi:hypothetical protein
MSLPRRIVLLVCLLGAIGLLVLLVSGVHNLTLLPGKPIPNPLAALKRPADGSATHPRSGSSDTWVVLAQSVLVVALLGVLIMAGVSRRFRRQLLILGTIGVVLVFGLSWLPHAYRGVPEQSQPQPTAAPTGSGTSPAKPEVPSVTAPGWGAILIGIGAAIVSAGLVLLFLVKIMPRLRRPREGSVLDELGERADEAARRIRAGEDPREAVLRCYKEMSEILSRRRRVVNHAHFTPREFATRLREAGMSDAHVDRLTAIFEEVRYGGRSGEPFKNEAVGCLEAIRRAHVFGDAA